jgi:Glycosyltransferase family 87
MIARSERSYPRAEPALVALVAAAGVVLFVTAWLVLHTGHYDDVTITDTGVYREYGDRMLEGEVPYRDFELEYPPGALTVFALPSLGSEGRYDLLFDALMLVCGAAAVALVAVALAAAGAGPGALAAGVGLAAVAPLLLGPVPLTRYDLWPAALLAGALAALAAGRQRLGLGVLGLAVAAKLYPLVVLPLALLYVARARGRREALVGLGVFVAVLALAVGPFALLGWDGLVESVTRHTGRPLQLESLGAAVLLVADRMRLYEATVATSHGSQNLVGSLPDALATWQTVAQALAVVLVWFLFARSSRGPARLLVASAAAVVGFVAFGKVLSPQFMIWLLPLVPLVVIRGAAVPLALFAGALVATQVWFPSRYWDVVALEGVVWFVLVRDVLLVALFVGLLLLIPRGREARGSP